MPSRNFCDRCDKEILQGEEIFSVETTRRSHDNEYMKTNDLFIMRKWVNPNQHMFMLCKDCISAILQVILWFKKDDSGD